MSSSTSVYMPDASSTRSRPEERAILRLDHYAYCDIYDGLQPRFVAAISIIFPVLALFAVVLRFWDRIHLVPSYNLSCEWSQSDRRCHIRDVSVIPTAVWSLVEPGLGVLAACLPVLATLLKSTSGPKRVSSTLARRYHNIPSSGSHVGQYPHEVQPRKYFEAENVGDKSGRSEKTRPGASDGFETSGVSYGMSRARIRS